MSDIVHSASATRGANETPADFALRATSVVEALSSYDGEAQDNGNHVSLLVEDLVGGERQITFVMRWRPPAALGG